MAFQWRCNTAKIQTVFHPRTASFIDNVQIFNSNPHTFTFQIWKGERIWKNCDFSNTITSPKVLRWFDFDPVSCMVDENTDSVFQIQGGSIPGQKMKGHGFNALN